MLRATAFVRVLAIASAVAACTHPNDVATTPTPAPAPAPAPAIVAPEPAPAPAPAPPPAPAVSGYNQPPKHVLDVLHAPSPASPIVSPTRDSILLVSWVDYPSIAQIAEPILKLAGVRVEPRTRRKHDTPGGYGVAACAQRVSLVDVASGRETELALPAGGCADGFNWAPDGKHFAFRNTAADAVELWLGDRASVSAHRLGDARLDPMLGSSLQWLAGKPTLLVKLVPEHQGAPPSASVVADGPNIQETDGKSGESSTYETRDTLQSKHDEDLFDYYASSQLALVDIATGAATPIGPVQIYTDVDAAPDGEHVLVTAVKKPYSYVTTYDNFAHDVVVLDLAHQTAKQIAELPVADRVPIAGVASGPRDFEWRQNEPATLVWAEALDGGDPNAKADKRDKVMMQRAPFDGAPTEIIRTEQRFAGFEWGEQKSFALLRDVDVNRRWTRGFAIDVDAKTKPRLLWDLSLDERYKNPGAPVERELPNGAGVVQQDGGAIFLRGLGASPDGDRPFLDRFDVATGKAERLFRSDKTAYEQFIAFAGDTRSLLTWHQTTVEPPNAFVRTLGAAVAGAPAGEATVASTLREVTHIADPTPEVRAIKKQLVKYKRKDGLELSFTLYTPPNYQPGTKLPAILYAYPLDYANASVAAQVSGSEQRFTTLRDYRLLLLSGYAIIDNAAFPIVGDPKKAYDTYLDQLVMDAQAAVDKAVELGVVDRDRIGVTGHSHGALMTANLLAHTDLFRAGAATSGSYNKTLTPFGFQNERRSVWKAQNVYLKVSPFFFADKLKVPLLIVHGADDANPGTTPLQAVKLYEAIRGNGGTARLVMLPHEPHWYSAMESNEQLAYEELRWFDKYVKDAGPRERGGGAAKATASH